MGNLGQWPTATRTGACEVCGRPNTDLYETPIGKFCCADQQTCYRTWSEGVYVPRRRRR